MTTLQDLLARVENAEGPGDISWYGLCETLGVRIYGKHSRIHTLFSVGAYMDCAIAITAAVLPGAKWEKSLNNGIRLYGYISNNYALDPYGPVFRHKTGNLYLSLIVATLKALIANPAPATKGDER